MRCIQRVLNATLAASNIQVIVELSVQWIVMYTRKGPVSVDWTLAQYAPIQQKQREAEAEAERLVRFVVGHLSEDAPVSQGLAHQQTSERQIQAPPE